MTLLQARPKNSVQQLQKYGQSVWLDYIRRNLIATGELQTMVESGEVWGVTSNLAIFQKAIAGSTDIEMNAKHQEQLQSIRQMIRDAKKVATCLGFGPRFLHSTGQAYKGGPNTGVFLQITCDDAIDVPVPGQKYSFGAVKAAQARGDFQVLAERNRRVLRVHLGKDVQAGLATLQTIIQNALV